MKGFHTQNNLFFERKIGGSVLITKYSDETRWADGSPTLPPIFVQEVDEGTWCSVIAAMSAGGEADDRYRLATDFHNSVGMRNLQPPPFPA